MVGDLNITKMSSQELPASDGCVLRRLIRFAQLLSKFSQSSSSSFEAPAHSARPARAIYSILLHAQRLPWAPADGRILHKRLFRFAQPLSKLSHSSLDASHHFPMVSHATHASTTH